MGKSKAKKTEVITSATPVQNSLSDALGFGQGIGGGINPIGFPGNQGSPYTEQVSNVNTLFKNLRWFLVSNFRQMLSEAYVEIGLIQTIVDVPVDDALRGGILVKSSQLDEDQIADLINSLDRDDDLNEVGTAAKWNRLYGGAGVLILTDQDPETPLDVESLSEESELEFRAVDMWELFWDQQNTEGYDPTIQQETFEYYSYYGQRVHKSRVMRMIGLKAPSFIRPRLRGWGFSVVETLMRSINQYLKATDLTFEVLDEFKVDVFKIKNLVNTLMSPQGEELVRRRVQLAAWQKNYQNALTMDSEDDWDHKQLSFTGMGEAMEQIRMQVASDMRMPMIKLFGQQMGKGGLGMSSGEDEIEVYNSMVESQVRNKIKYVIMRVCEIKCQMMFGFVPDDLSIDFEPLRVMSAEQEQNVKTQKFNRLIQLKGAGEISSKELREACNKGDLVDITLDPNVETVGGYMDDMVQEGGNDPESAGDKAPDDPGANRPDTRKPTAAGKGGAPKGDVKPKAKPTENKKKNTKVQNSVMFDKKSYEASGGDGWIEPRRRLFFTYEKAKDKGLWQQCIRESEQAYGEMKWQFVAWLYEKRGGEYTFGRE